MASETVLPTEERLRLACSALQEVPEITRLLLKSIAKSGASEALTLLATDMLRRIETLSYAAWECVEPNNTNPREISEVSREVTSLFQLARQAEAIDG